MNSITEDSGGHALDGIDPDAPRNIRRGPSGYAAMLAEDLRELDSMNEADVKRYSEPLPGSNSIKR